MQNTFSQSGNDSKWFLTKIIFQNSLMANETPSRPPPLHGKCHLKFPFWLLAHFPNVISIYADLWNPAGIETTIELNSNMSSSTANSAKNCKATILFIRNRFPYMSRSLIYVGLFFLFTVKQLFQTLLNFVLKSFAPTGTIKSTRRLFWK